MRARAFFCLLFAVGLTVGGGNARAASTDTWHTASFEIPLPGGKAPMVGSMKFPVSSKSHDPYGYGAKLPVILVLGGFENAANVLNLLNPNRPAIIVSFDYPFA